MLVGVGFLRDDVAGADVARVGRRHGRRIGYTGAGGGQGERCAAYDDMTYERWRHAAVRISNLLFQPITT
ncbi:unnamed protein product, partial [marine sediment metagenome]